MANASHQSVLSPAEPVAPADVCAVFVIDATGNVVATNATAREVWCARSRPLVALAFAQLFETEATPVESDVHTMQWQALKSEAYECWTRRVARPLDGPARHVRVRIERAFGGGGSYIGTVQPLPQGP